MSAYEQSINEQWTFSIEQWNAELLLQNISPIHKPFSLHLGFKKMYSEDYL